MVLTLQIVKQLSTNIGQLISSIVGLANSYIKHMDMTGNLCCVQHYEALVHVNIILVVPAYMSFESENVPQYAEWHKKTTPYWFH